MISIVVPCFNGGPRLGTQLHSLLDQTYAGAFEVLLVDNRSTDSTAKIAKHIADNDPRLKYVGAFEKQGINYARNRGIQEAVGHFILFCDADDRVDRDWLLHLAYAAASGAELVGGALIRTLNSVTVSESGLNRSLWNFPSPAGANCGAHKDVFARVGLFDESYMGGGDETDFFWRAQLAGCKLLYVPEAKVEYCLRSTNRELSRQQFLYGKSHAKLFSKFGPMGMPRSNCLRSLLSVLKACLEILFSRRMGRRQRSALSKLSLHTGRVAGSFSNHVFYV